MNEEVKTGFWGYATMLFFIVLATIPVWIWFLSISNWIRIPLAVIGGLFAIGVVIVAIETSNSITSYEIESNEYFYSCEEGKK